MKALLEKIRRILRDRRVRRAFTRFIGGTAAVVVFVTTYALILPAITLEREAMCGMEAHQHDDSCYSEELICEIPESDGHHHTDECYSVTREQICELEEHVHSEENGCYDEEGNLICELQEHQHDDSCYEEARTLTCGQEESNGHHHGPECYEKVLTCGKEAHTHSEECYKDESSAVAASTSSPAEAAQSETTYTEETDESAAGDATTSVLPEEMAEENLSEGRVPTLDPLYMDAMLTKDTAFYYYHPEEGEIVEDSSVIDRWKKVDRDTELKMTDLVKVYLPYTIPAGSLNQTNQIARYRLPYNLHLTDEQIRAINRNENGVASSVTDSDTEQDNSGYGSAYEKYLGAEAVEGKRKPNEELHSGDTEYISAVVKAENVYNESNGEYEGQDLIFIFTPYTIEENQDVYDQDGNMTAKGRKVYGWFAVDFNMSQIDWVEDETDADLDNTTIGKTAEFIFAEKDKEYGADEIRRELRLVEKKDEESAAENMTSEEDETASEAETSAAAEEAASESTTENATEAETAAAGETADAATADSTAEAAAETGEKPEKFISGTLEATGDGYKITLDYTAEAKIPADADLQVREITETSDKEAYEACLAEARKQVAGDDKSSVDQNASRFFDIEIVVKGTDETGKETITKIEPAAPVSVNIQLSETPAGNNTSEAVSGDDKSQTSDPTVLHFAEDGVETVESTVQNGAGQGKNQEEGVDATNIQFESDSFSIYGVVYTVDFLYEVDGKVYEISLPGGGFMSFRKLVEVLGITRDSNSEDNKAENKESDTKTASITMDDVEISDETKKFVADVVDVEFSSPELVWVGKTETSCTVKELKEANRLNCQYSADLTADQIADINAQTVEAGDWALLSVQPFTSKEYLTVTMATGESFRVSVTDAQIKKEYITASGETYTITVTYGEDAGIPDGADLEVEEIVEGTSEYQNYLNNSADELRAETDDISFARFFDITIVDKDGAAVEPQTSVTVQIAYKDAIEIGQEEQLSVVHFADKGTEIINDVSLNESGTTVTYVQDSFSVTGTVVSGNPRNGNAYMLIVDYEGEKYIINNDGTLIPVTSLNNSQISTDYPMLWTYNYQYGGNFRIASEATGFDANNVAVGFYYRYIDPNVDSGLTEENAQHPNLAGSTQVNYNNNFISSASNNNLYIGISDEGGTLHIVGNQHGASKAAKITLYNPGNVRSADPANHSVNHIDVSISGDADVDVPLAYGIYYYKEGDTWHKLIVGADVPDVTGDGVSPENTTRVDNHTENLKVENVHVTSTDMKSATITAKRHDTGAVVNDAFYITGYSANHSTQYSTDQVRIEGSFKVADMAPVNNDYWTVNSYDTRSRRLQNIIDYTVSADKRLNLPLTYTVGGNSYALYKDPLDDADQVSVVATVNLSATFNYWDHAGDNNPANDGNECPPLQPEWGYDYEWKNGGIHPYGISGMDFVLHGKGTTAAKILALEITKTLKFLDEDGSVESVQYNQPITFDYEVFTDQPGDPSTVRVPGGEVHDYGTYKALNSTEITVRPTTDGSNSGHVYDYDVTDGMYYVREVRDDNFPTELTIGGDTYRYVSTNIKTEYSYRHNQYRDRETGYHQMHEVGISSETADLNSIPEVLGTYTADDGQEENNEFLEYYFENVYQKNATPPPPEPIIKTLEINLDKKWRDGDNTTAPTNGTVTFKLHRIAITTRENGHDIASPQPVTDGDGFPKTMTISSLEDWKITIPNLTYYESDTQRTYERSYKYYLEETERTGDAERYGVPSFTNGFGSIHNPVEGQDNDEPITVEVENKTGNVLKIQKRWLNVDPDVAPNVTIRIWRMALNEYGNPYNNSRPTELEGYSPQTLTNDDRVQGENWWQVEIPFPSETTFDYQEGGQTHQGHYVYYISEDNLGSDYLDPRFITLSGDQTIGDYDAYSLVGNGQGIGFGNMDWGQRNGKKYKITDTDEVYLYADSRYQQDTTMAVMNAPNNTFHHVYFSKEWYKYENGTFVKSTNGNDTKNYAIGIQIYQRVKSSNNTGEWHPFAKPIYIGARNGIIDCDGHNYIMDENNPFKFNEDPSVDNGVWKWLLRDEGAQNGFPRYAMVNGQKVYYEYEAREIGVYTTENGQKVSSVDQLQRVYDYSNIQNWYFDENAAQNQSNGPKGINVEAGELKVTKTWQGGHTGSKIYFKVYRGNEDITDSIVADPDSYGLTEHQVLDDGNHTALIVTSDGTNWATLLIQGLAEAPASGGSAYVYSIKEIGYSEADGTDWWDGEVVTNSDGSARKDPQGNDIVAHVSDLLTGYQIDSGGNQSPVNGRSPGTTVVDDEPHTITVNNNYVEKYKDFEFSKVWENGAGEFQTWPADISSIKIDLYAKAGTGDPVKIADGIDFYITPPTQDSKQEFTWNGVKYNWEVSVDASGTIYTFKIPNLPAKVTYPNGDDYEYSVVEQTVTDYTTSYGHNVEVQKTVEVKDGEGNTVYEEDGVTPKTKIITVKSFVDEATNSASNGKVISNKKDEPQTGSLNLSKKVAGDGADQNKEFTFTVSLTAPAGLTLNHSYKISKNGGTEEDLALTLTDDDTTASISVTLKHNETWEIKDLPVGTSYTITETDYTNAGYTASVTKGTATNGGATGAITAGTKDDIEYTNTYSAVTIIIEKVLMGDDTKKLNGAVFQLFRKTSGGVYEVFENDAFDTVGEGDSAKKTGTFTISSGTITISSIPKGEYKLHEVSPPAGYIITGNSDTFFRVNEDKTITLTGQNGNEVEKDESTGVQDTVMVKHVNGTFTVRNEPGAALPNTGGPGTHLFYLLGSALAIFAAALLGMRRIRH